MGRHRTRAQSDSSDITSGSEYSGNGRPDKRRGEYASSVSTRLRPRSTRRNVVYHDMDSELDDFLESEEEGDSSKTSPENLPVALYNTIEKFLARRIKGSHSSSSGVMPHVPLIHASVDDNQSAQNIINGDPSTEEKMTPVGVVLDNLMNDVKDNEDPRTLADMPIHSVSQTEPDFKVDSQTPSENVTEIVETANLDETVGLPPTDRGLPSSHSLATSINLVEPLATNSSVIQYEWLVKYHNVSYLHCEWLSEAEVNEAVASDRPLRTRFNNFVKKLEAGLEIPDVDLLDCVPERIVDCSDVFRALYPTKAAEIGRTDWTMYCLKIVDALVCFNRDHRMYGIPFLRPVEEEKDGAPGYYQVVKNPMDFSTVQTKLYLRQYGTPQEFWSDVKLVFSNCLEYNASMTDISTQCRVLEVLFDKLYHEWAKISRGDLSEDTEDIELPFVELNTPDLKIEQVTQHISFRNQLKDPNRQIFYLVKWKGRSYTELSWELASDISDKMKIAQYHRHVRVPEYVIEPRGPGHWEVDLQRRMLQETLVHVKAAREFVLGNMVVSIQTLPSLSTSGHAQAPKERWSYDNSSKDKPRHQRVGVQSAAAANAAADQENRQALMQRAALMIGAGGYPQFGGMQGRVHGGLPPGMPGGYSPGMINPQWGTEMFANPAVAAAMQGRFYADGSMPVAQRLVGTGNPMQGMLNPAMLAAYGQNFSFMGTNQAALLHGTRPQFVPPGTSMRPPLPYPTQQSHRPPFSMKENMTETIGNLNSNQREVPSSTGKEGQQRPTTMCEGGQSSTLDPQVRGLKQNTSKTKWEHPIFTSVEALASALPTSLRSRILRLPDETLLGICTPAVSDPNCTISAYDLHNWCEGGEPLPDVHPQDFLPAEQPSADNPNLSSTNTNAAIPLTSQFQNNVEPTSSPDLLLSSKIISNASESSPACTTASISMKAEEQDAGIKDNLISGAPVVEAFKSEGKPSLIEIPPKSAPLLDRTRPASFAAKSIYAEQFSNMKKPKAPPAGVSRHYPASPSYKGGRKLFDYQLEGLNWLLDLWAAGNNGILADEMGLGKTVQTMALLWHMFTKERMKGPFLVVAPLSTLDHWKRTAEDWSDFNVVLYYDENGRAGRDSLRRAEWFHHMLDWGQKKTVPSPDGKLIEKTHPRIIPTTHYKFQLLLTSYEIFASDAELLVPITWQFVVVDEAHRLKNRLSKTLQLLKQVACRHTLLLTGTPVQNNTEELWPLLNYIEPVRFCDLDAFKIEFGELETSEQVSRLTDLLRPHLLRRVKEDVAESIPPLEETIIDVELTMIQKAYYKAIFERNKTFLFKHAKKGHQVPSLMNIEMELRKCCNHPFMITGVEQREYATCKNEGEQFKKLVESSGKLVLLGKLLPKLKSEGHKVLIFSQFQHTLTLIQEFLNYQGWEVERLDGQVKGTDRTSAIARFNDTSLNKFVFLLSTRAGGLGINLTSADTVIIFDSDWNPQNDIQATARAHRIGQEREVKVYRLITARTYESDMFDRASKKLGLNTAVFHRGAFDSKNREKAEGDDMSRISAAAKAPSKEEIEEMLKKGAFYLLEGNADAAIQFQEGDIEEILSRNSRLVRYQLTGMSSTFAKTSFRSDKASDLSLDDPDFWQKVLNDSSSRRLLARLNDGSSTVDEASRELFMKDLQAAVEGIAAEDEPEPVIEALVQMSNLQLFSAEHRQQAEEWLARVNTSLEVLGEGNDKSGSPTSTTGDDEDGRGLRRSARVSKLDSVAYLSPEEKTKLLLTEDTRKLRRARRMDALTGDWNDDIGHEMTDSPTQEDAADGEGSAEMQKFQRRLLDKFAEQGNGKVVMDGFDDALSDSLSEDDDDEDEADTVTSKKKVKGKGKVAPPASKAKRKARVSKARISKLTAEECDISGEVGGDLFNVSAGVPLPEPVKKPRKPKTPGTGKRKRTTATAAAAALGEDVAFLTQELGLKSPVAGTPKRRKQAERTTSKKTSKSNDHDTSLRAPILMPNTSSYVFDSQLIGEDALQGKVASEASSLVFESQLPEELETTRIDTDDMHGGASVNRSNLINNNQEPPPHSMISQNLRFVNIPLSADHSENLNSHDDLTNVLRTTYECGKLDDDSSLPPPQQLCSSHLLNQRQLSDNHIVAAAGSIVMSSSPHLSSTTTS